MRLSKNRSILLGFNGRRRLHRAGGLLGRPGRWSPGLYPVPTQPQAPLRKFLGSPGGCQKWTGTRALASTTKHRLNTRGGSSGRAVGFPCHCWQRECLTRIRAGGRPAFTGQRAHQHQLTPVAGNDPPRSCPLAPGRRRAIPFPSLGYPARQRSRRILVSLILSRTCRLSG